MRKTITFGGDFRACLLALLISMRFASAAFGANTGWHYPQHDSVDVNSHWVNPDYVLTCNSSNAYYMGLDTVDSLFTSGYGFNLPGNASIDSLWYRYIGWGSGDGDEEILKIGFIAGSSRNASNSFHLSSMPQADSAHLISFDHNIFNVSCVNSTAFGLYAVTAGDEWLTDTYLDCLAIMIFYHESPTSSRREKLLKMEDNE